MDEWIDIVTATGLPTGKTALKSEAHQQGWYHNTVHVWCYRNDASGRKILLQKRARTKRTFPGLWDVSVAGHIGAGEEIVAAAVREVEEEIGLTISASELHKIGVRKGERFHPNGIKDFEFYHVFLVALTVPVVELQVQADEVEDIQLIDLSILQDASKHGTYMVPNFNGYYDYIFKHLNAHLDTI